MSYDIRLLDPMTKEPILFGQTHDIRGGTYIDAGTNEAWLNITYNYAPHFKHLGRKGIRTIYGKTGAESIPMLKKAAETLEDTIDEDYWKPTEGNARRALLDLLQLQPAHPRLNDRQLLRHGPRLLLRFLRSH